MLTAPVLLVLPVSLLVLLAGPALGNYPLFDVATRMRVLLVPQDAAVGAVIYRLRATDSDFDYPLHFDVGGDGGETPHCFLIPKEHRNKLKKK